MIPAGRARRPAALARTGERFDIVLPRPALRERRSTSRCSSGRRRRAAGRGRAADRGRALPQARAPGDNRRASRAPAQVGLADHVLVVLRRGADDATTRIAGRLSGLVRPHHQRPPRHHRPRPDGVRRGHHRHPGQPREEPLFTVEERVAIIRESLLGRAAGEGGHASPACSSTTREGVGASVIVRGLRADLRLRVRVPDGAHEPPPQPAHRDRVHDAGRAATRTCRRGS